MRISVTKADIAKGDPDDYLSCPIALALKRKATKVRVGSVTADFKWKGRKYLDIYLPSEAVRFIEQFDSGESVKPFTFDLSIK